MTNHDYTNEAATTHTANWAPIRSAGRPERPEVNRLYRTVFGFSKVLGPEASAVLVFDRQTRRYRMAV